MRSCEEYRELISAYFDYELDRATRMEVEAHVETCAECAEVFRQYRSMCEAPHAAEQPESVVPKVMERINEALDKGDPFGKPDAAPRQARRASKPLSKTAKTWLTIAACMFLLLTSVLFNQGPVTEQQMMDMAESGKESYESVAQTSSADAGADNEAQESVSKSETQATTQERVEGTSISDAADGETEESALFAALDGAQRLRVEIGGEQAAELDAAGIARLSAYLKERPAEAADAAAERTIGEIELTPDAGIKISVTEQWDLLCSDGETDTLIRLEKSGEDDFLSIFGD